MEDFFLVKLTVHIANNVLELKFGFIHGFFCPLVVINPMVVDVNDLLEDVTFPPPSTSATAGISAPVVQRLEEGAKKCLVNHVPIKC